MSIFGQWPGEQNDEKTYREAGHLAGEALGGVEQGARDAARYVSPEHGITPGPAIGPTYVSPEAQLGETSDPRALVCGNADSIRSVAQTLQRFSHAFGQTADGLERIETGGWKGAAADAFRARFSGEPGKWSKARSAMDQVSEALHFYAGEIESAQFQAHQAIQLWDQGQSASREQARVRLNAAREELDHIAGRVAQEITTATDMAPAEPSFWSQMGDDLFDTIQAGALSQTSFDIGAVKGLASQERLGRELSPLDPWNISHAPEYVAGLSGAAAAIVGDAANPVQGAKDTAGGDWRSDPSEALGAQAPGVLEGGLTGPLSLEGVGEGIGEGIPEGAASRGSVDPGQESDDDQQ